MYKSTNTQKSQCIFLCINLPAYNNKYINLPYIHFLRCINLPLYKSKCTNQYIVKNG